MPKYPTAGQIKGLPSLLLPKVKLPSLSYLWPGGHFIKEKRWRVGPGWACPLAFPGWGEEAVGWWEWSEVSFKEEIFFHDISFLHFLGIPSLRHTFPLPCTALVPWVSMDIRVSQPLLLSPLHGLLGCISCTCVFYFHPQMLALKPIFLLDNQLITHI